MWKILAKIVSEKKKKGFLRSSVGGIVKAGGATVKGTAKIAGKSTQLAAKGTYAAGKATTKATYATGKVAAKGSFITMRAGGKPIRGILMKQSGNTEQEWQNWVSRSQYSQGKLSWHWKILLTLWSLLEGLH